MVPTLPWWISRSIKKQTNKHFPPVLFRSGETNNLVGVQREEQDGTIPPIARETHLSGSGTTPAAMRCGQRSRRAGSGERRGSWHVGALSPARRQPNPMRRHLWWVGACAGQEQQTRRGSCRDRSSPSCRSGSEDLTGACCRSAASSCSAPSSCGRHLSLWLARRRSPCMMVCATSATTKSLTIYVFKRKKNNPAARCST
jgi:hypothetical protein